MNSFCSASIAPDTGAARRVLVPAAAECLGHAADVDVAFRSHADAVLLPFDLLEEDHRLRSP